MQKRRLDRRTPQRAHSQNWLCHLVDLDGGGGGGGGDFVEAGGDGAGDVEYAFCADSVFAEERDGLAGVAADADARIDFDFAEDRDAVGLRGFCAFAVAEDVDSVSCTSPVPGGRSMTR